MLLPSREKRWYALYTKSRTEKKVHQLLMEKGIETYLPLLKTLKQWSDRKKWVEEPLFRSYIFIRISEKERLDAIRTDGVVRMISFQGRPVSIPDKQIEAVRAYINEGETRVEKEVYFTPGDRVEVTRGTLQGLQGTMVETKGKKRVMVEIEGIGEKIMLNIPKSSLKSIQK
jgi:transcription elongation factor/antiterminator RfaH